MQSHFVYFRFNLRSWTNTKNKHPDFIQHVFFFSLSLSRFYFSIQRHLYFDNRADLCGNTMIKLLLLFNFSTIFPPKTKYREQKFWIPNLHPFSNLVQLFIPKCVRVIFFIFFIFRFFFSLSFRLYFCCIMFRKPYLWCVCVCGKEMQAICFNVARLSFGMNIIA